MFFLVLYIVFGASFADSDEGFYTSEVSRPKVIEQAWNSTAMVASPEPRGRHSGAAIFVGFAGPSKKIGYFLTCEHVMRGVCGVKEKCRNLSLYHGYRLFTDSARTMATEDSARWVRNFEVVSLNRDSDLALLKVRMDSLPLSAPAFQSHVRAFEEVYAIGAPLMQERTLWGKNVKVPDLRFNQLVWSKGRIVALIQTTRAEDKKKNKPLPVRTMIGHTADLLRGNSGGPLINAQGELIGINASLAPQNPRREYSMDDKSDPLVLAGSIPISKIVEFLKASGQTIY